jgi:hypothetical protein
LLKEIVTSAPPGPLFFGAVVELLAAAGEMKATPDEVQAWAERAAKAAEANGVRWQMYVLLRMSRALADQPAHAVAALDLVRRAERLLEPADEVGVQLAVLDLSKRLLLQTNNAAAVEPVQARIDALEARDYRDYLAASPVRPELFAGRKVRSDRVVLLELFTGTEDPPSLAAVLAFDAVARAYKPTEVVRLQYHLHQPFADPLANKAAEARWAYYQTQLGNAPGVPTAVFNGRPGAVGGGGADVAAIKLKQYRSLIDRCSTNPPGLLCNWPPSELATRSRSRPGSPAWRNRATRSACGSPSPKRRCGTPEATACAITNLSCAGLPALRTDCRCRNPRPSTK